MLTTLYPHDAPAVINSEPDAEYVPAAELAGIVRVNPVSAPSLINVKTKEPPGGCVSAVVIKNPTTNMFEFVGS